jgi:hypothetical protein
VHGHHVRTRLLFITLQNRLNPIIILPNVTDVALIAITIWLEHGIQVLHFMAQFIFSNSMKKITGRVGKIRNFPKSKKWLALRLS